MCYAYRPLYDNQSYSFGTEIHFFLLEMPKFRGYDFALVVSCGLTRFTRVFPCTTIITGEETIKILLEKWFSVYGAPKEINSDEDV